MPEIRDDGPEHVAKPGEGEGVTDAPASVSADGGMPAPAGDPGASVVPDAGGPTGAALLAVPDTGTTPAGATLPAVAPADTGWLRVSPKYLVVEIVGSVIGMVVFVGALLIAYYFWQSPWVLWAAIALGVISLIGIAFEPRRVRSIAYRLREDDLLFRRGIMYQRQVAVPYGRMQLVDITRGPVARALGLADLKFVTAAASTAVTVPGLPMEEADRLRDELVALAETRRAGL
jgi:membrane protein YdbS with pleckstrin-like domain